MTQNDYVVMKKSSREKLIGELKEVKKENQQLKRNRDKARKMIFDNYGVLDKYGIEMLDDILRGGSDE